MIKMAQRRCMSLGRIIW